MRGGGGLSGADIVLERRLDSRELNQGSLCRTFGPVTFVHWGDYKLSWVKIPILRNSRPVPSLSWEADEELRPIRGALASVRTHWVLSGFQGVGCAVRNDVR